MKSEVSIGGGGLVVAVRAPAPVTMGLVLLCTYMGEGVAE